MNVLKRFYRPELDWLRFLAFGMVFVTHACPPNVGTYTKLGIPESVVQIFIPFIRTGGYGVDLFFALSAFLITKLLLMEKDLDGTIDIRSFYLRRIMRIWPLYFAFILVAAPFDVVGSGTYYLALIAFFGNWYQMLFLKSAAFAGPLWSVCVEEQFYIVWPALMKKNKTRNFAGIMLLLIGIAAGTRLYLFLNGGEFSSLWFNTFARLDPFACGGLLALLLHGKPFLLSYSARSGILACGAGLFWIAGSNLMSPQWAITLFALPTVALASTLCILAFVGGIETHSKSRFLSVWAYLGKISYGLYVFHTPALELAKKIQTLPYVTEKWLWIGQDFIALGTTLLAAMISYALLEKPFLRMKEHFAHVASRPT